MDTFKDHPFHLHIGSIFETSVIEVPGNVEVNQRIGKNYPVTFNRFGISRSSTFGTDSNTGTLTCIPRYQGSVFQVI